jgi:tRNA A-37 threonylcarbamoyl transferase component Bud32
MKSLRVLGLAKLCLPLLDSGVCNPEQLTEADVRVQTITRLWGGMGHIYQVTCHYNNDRYSFVVKHVVPPKRPSSIGDRRKAESYKVEANFYQIIAPKLVKEHGLKIPQTLHVETCNNEEVIICMTYVQDHKRLMDEMEYIRAVLRWLATLHASYWGRADEIVYILQPQGSYWYLDTRPDEHAAMPGKGWEGRLKRAARAIDNRLKRDSMQTIIHGDAKDANVIVVDNQQVAMVDFQYCGKGPPTKDLAYFLCSYAVQDEREAVAYYLQQLTEKLPSHVSPPTLEELQESLGLAHCDFCRFMSGWGMSL